jgi:SWI/SNF-related matrix-associated actin-dependent regulator of chromatin subfamily A containing DEAD/H box 1
MRRVFEEIPDDEWSNHNFKSSRVLKRPHRSAQPSTQPPPPIDSFRYDPKAASATSRRAATVVLSDDDDDFDPGFKDRARRTEKLQPVFKRPQHMPASRAPPSKGSFRNNPKPFKAAATAGLSDSADDDDFDIFDSKASRRCRSSKAADTSGHHSSDDDEFDLEDDYSDDVSDIPAPRTSRPRHATGRQLVTAAIDISGEDEDLDLADDDFDYQDPRPFQSHRTTARRCFVIGDDDDSDGPVTAGRGDGDDDDEINWSELENEDDEDRDYSNDRSAHVEEDEGDVVGMALRKCSRISLDLRQELYGSSARNCDSYAEIDTSTCRIVTQVTCLVHVVSAFFITNVMVQWYLGILE